MTDNRKHESNMKLESKIVPHRLINIAVELTYPEKVDQFINISFNRNTLLNWAGNRMSSLTHKIKRQYREAKIIVFNELVEE